jgi:hypothetical protein
MSQLGVIANEPPSKCELCGKDDEQTRPYGPKGERVCFACGMQDPAAVEQGVDRLIFGGALKTNPTH